MPNVTAAAWMASRDGMHYIELLVTSFVYSQRTHGCGC